MPKYRTTRYNKNGKYMGQSISEKITKWTRLRDLMIGLLFIGFLIFMNYVPNS